MPTRVTLSIGLVAADGGEDAGGDAEHQREGDGEHRQLEGHGQALEDERDHGLAGAPRGAEVAVGEPAEPAPVLHAPRLVEAEEALELRHHRRAHDGVGADHLLDDRARDQAQHEEDEHGQARPA